MSNNTKKISELVSRGVIPESGLLPVALAGSEKETYKVNLTDVRSNLLFENAYKTIAAGIADTKKGETFFVYTDENELYVAAFTNVNGSSAAAIYKDDLPVIYGTGKLIQGGGLGAYTSYVSYLYNNGFAAGGETSIVLPFDVFDVAELFINGSHQYKNFSFTFDRKTNTVSLGKALTKNATVILYVRPYPGSPVTPVEPGISDYVNVSWLYNDGSAVGGESSLTPPWSFTTVPAIYLNGSKQVLNLHYEIDPTGKKINLAKPLNATDVVEVILGGSRAQIVVDVSGTPAEVLVVLATSAGASKVLTSFGSTVEQFVKGWHGVDTFAQLRAQRPNYDGERIKLRSYYNDNTTNGQGEFIGHFGTAVDDDGHIAAGSDYYWTRVSTNEVNLYDYGVYLQKGADIVGNPSAAVDMSKKVQAAINRSILLGVPLQSPFYLGNDIDFVTWGILLLKSIRFDGIKNALGDYPLLSYGSYGSYTSDPGLSGVTGVSEPYVVFNMNADFDNAGKKLYGTNRGGQRFGKVVVYNLGGRNVHLNGQLHIMKNSTFECLHGSQLKGTAVNMGTSFDYQIRELGAHSSGDANYFALDGSVYPAADKMDEHNAYTIESLFAHNCWEHSVRVIGSKGNIVRVHEEATQVNSTDDYAGYGSAYGSLNGFGYTTSMLGGTGTVIGAYGVQALETSANPVVVQLTMYGTTFNSVYCSNAVNVSVIAQGNAANSVGVLKTISGSLMVNDQARTAFGTVNLNGDLAFRDVRSTISSLVMTGNVTSSFGSIQRANITGDLTIYPLSHIAYGAISGNLIINQGYAGGVYASNLIVNGNMSIVNGGGTSAWLDNVVIRGTFSTTQNANLYLTNFRVDGATTITGTGLSIEFINSRFTAVTMVAGVTGLWTFDMNCSATSFTGYVDPTTAPRPGKVTKNPNTGQVNIYLAGGWKTLIAAPA